MTGDQRWYAWSAEALSRAADHAVLVVNPLVYAEISLGGPRTRYPGDVPVREGALLHLPGGDIAEAGIRDLQHGVESIEALLVASFADRLRRCGLDVPAVEIPDAEHGLYHLIAAKDPDGAHSRYNALVRRMVAFARALECER